MSSNFGFLSDHNPKLVQLGAFAERYFRDDLPTCLIKVRQLAELVAKLIAAHHTLYTKDRETFEERLRRLHYDRHAGSAREMPSLKNIHYRGKHEAQQYGQHNRNENLATHIEAADDESRDDDRC